MVILIHKGLLVIGLVPKWQLVQSEQGHLTQVKLKELLWDASLYSSVSKSVSGDFDAAVKLETSRMLVAALKSSDLPADAVV